MRSDLGLLTMASPAAVAPVLTKKRVRKEKLSIYLAKDGKIADEDLLDLSEAKEPVEIKVQEGTAVLYVKRDKMSVPPSWTTLFTSHQSLPGDLFGTTKSVGALFIIRYLDHVFALTFGTGHHLLNQDLIERDFGLRVTLNSVDPDKLRSLDKASYEINPLNSRVQSIREVDIFQLRTDSELELVHAVTGVSKVPIFGSHVTGRDALTVATSVNIDGILEILSEALDRYSNKLPAQFDWIDNINRVKDPTEVEILDLELDQVLAKGDYKNLYLGEPEIVDWEGQIGYSFDIRPNTPRYPVLQFQNFIEYAASKSFPLTVSTLKSVPVHINNGDYSSVKAWAAYRCLCAEVEYAQKYYILRNGIWYRVENYYIATVDKFLSENIEEFEAKLPNYNHEREEDYNEVVSKLAGFTLMDKDFIKIGGPSDKVEFCDLIYKDSHWIHVKYYRSSATLSHLFSQGAVAAQAFVGESEFRKKLNEKLPESAKISNPEGRPDPTKYKVIYAIATKKSIPSELPFFSKVTLKQAVKSLSMYGFKVATSQIPVEPDILALKKIKPKKKT